eukprot:TRINITY_DN44745_c0_g1_i1.p1 TRINITY_DN44745_c0_g1~~TRINITY_DN44745_c0_g1_i1.p1  ORF type:complete len:463 (-),score=66.55 TRINITY_DN44745_c0_g1_i1:425-1813(-)
MAAEIPLIAKVLERFPDVNPTSLNFPADCGEWSEKDVELFVGSGGFLKPKKKKPPSAASSSGYAASQTAVVPAPNDRNCAAPAQLLPDTTPDPEPANVQQASATSALSTEELSRKQAPSLTVEVAELALTVWHDGEFWAPYTNYMEDLGERGLKLTGALNKCERFRNIGLKKGAGFTLGAIKDKYGAGILLREFALEVTAAPPVEILSHLWVSLRLELPCSPFMPMFQTVIPYGSDVPVCKAVFGMLMLNMSTMSVLQDNKIYEQVAEPLRQAFGIAKPTGAEGVPKFPRLYPTRNRPFRPLKFLEAECIIMPGDCDMYRVIFHPQMVAVCERVNFAIGAAFRDQPSIAIYANLARPAGIGDVFNVRVFVEPGDDKGSQSRVLYVFSSNTASGASASGPTLAEKCKMTAFLVYGQPPGKLYSEDVGACAATKFAQLEAFATGGAVGVADKVLDLSSCKRLRG